MDLGLEPFALHDMTAERRDIMLGYLLAIQDREKAEAKQKEADESRKAIEKMFGVNLSREPSKNGNARPVP